ncbi:sorting nexin [Plakobranchus ocellatus]|uniref:Sorting nexin n=1 Tax=Plakobranchus ocellatus TaxID=259542 RepID=A0AAV3YXP1_9GAST|nr:sorting nexin [Plakobranchus ocellatus]
MSEQCITGTGPYNIPMCITPDDIGDGWWEARSQDGRQGLVPETYVEIISAPEPQFPPPPPPMVADTGFSTNGYNTQQQQQQQQFSQQQQSFEDWDDDWDDDDDGGSSNSTGGTSQQDLAGQGNFGLAAPRREGKQISPGSEMSKYGTVKSSFNRFSHFAKSGGEAFLLGQTEERVSDSDKIRIVETADGPMWLNQDAAYTCTVTSPKKESKMKGLKSFIAYQLTPSFSNLQVSRRYKHFDWLHERLEVKFVCIPIPPLPDKAVTGRYESEFVQERMRQLQAWVNRMVRHPVICRSDVLHHFLTCTDEKKWKVGKRKAEKDEFQGAKFFQLVEPPNQALETRDLEGKMEQFCKFVMNMTDNVKTLITVHHDYAKKQIGPFKREYTKIGTSLKQLAVTFKLESSDYSRNLTTAIDLTGDAYNEIGEMFEKQPPREEYPLIEALYEYKGILQTYPEVLKVHEGAIGKAKECIKLQEEGKMNETEVTSVLTRADTISYATLAEMNNFQRDRVIDFKAMMQSYLREQIDFYKKLTEKLETALHHYDNA